MEEVEARIVEWDNEKAKNNKITKANALVEARYKLTVREQRLILMCVSLLSPEDEEFPTVRFKVRDMVEVLELNTEGYYHELKDILRKLLSRVLEIPKEDGGYMLLHWVESAEYIPGSGEVELRISRELKPYLLKLKERFTSYYLKSVLGLRSSYAIRLYELLKQYQNVGRRRMTIEEIRSLLKIEPDEYTRYNDFKRYVILQAQKELKEKTDLYFDFREIKRGRKVVEIEFIILENPRIKELEGKAKAEEEKERLRRRYEELLEKWKPYLEKVELRRLSEAQAIFFLENSLLEPEQTLRAIEGDDLNPMVRNPVGTLFNSLPLRSNLKDLWLLKLEPVKSAPASPASSGMWEGFVDWESRWEKKWKLARKVLDEYGIDYTLPKVPASEEEAVEILTEVERVIAKALWEKLSEEEKKEIYETYRKYRDKEELFKALVRASVLEKFKVPSLSFYVD